MTSGIPVGLCQVCRFARRIESRRGSTFWLCERSTTDARFPRYPPLPVLACIGFASARLTGAEPPPILPATTEDGL